MSTRRFASLVLLLAFSAACAQNVDRRAPDDARGPAPRPSAPGATAAEDPALRDRLAHPAWAAGEDWTVWWRLNRDDILRLEDALKKMRRQTSTSASPFFFGGGGGGAAPVDSGWSGEEYAAVASNRFEDPLREPLSTFAVDVDTASYSNVRRILGEGRLPPAGAVRIEEFLNFFRYSYPEPADGRPLAVATEVAECPWAPTHSLVRIGVQARRIDESAVPPRNLVFLLDVSGSMASGDKLPLVKAGLKLLVDRLRPEDRVAIVVYAGASGVVLEPTSGWGRGEILAALERLEAGGSTNGGAGIRAAYDLAARHFDPAGINRVILATDGDFNVGTTSAAELERLIAEKRKTGVFLTVLGVGTGNLNDARMEALADKGNGSYHYLDSYEEARRVLVEEAGGTLVTVAKDVKIQVELNPARVGAWRLVGYENRVLPPEDFLDDARDAGEVGAGHSVTALYEIVPPGEEAAGLVEPLRYQDPPARTGDRRPGELLLVKVRYQDPRGGPSAGFEIPVADPGNVNWTSANEDWRWAAAVAAFALVLRDSEFRGAADYDLVLALARTATGSDPHRAAMLDLVDRARRRAAAPPGAEVR